MIMKRRRPFKRPDGTFNYNPDVYCDKYDETSGSCADGDECPYAHRNAGDTERRYHPRYFKTGNCIYETMENGACVKNGLHCAFAHGPDDIRLPVYDIREVQDASSKFTINLPASLEKERVLSEDPKWNEMFHVLACYKTELCKKPPRMCRQGYSCPFYHNGKDKRRAPDKFLYRSTPCPTVRPGDEWQDSNLCDTGDACVYCHTRTEQQFHPEIYKSTKCNDVLNSGYCPRGPFCAFAHCDTEMTIGRDFSANVQQEHQCASSCGLQSSLNMELNSLSSNSLILSSSTAMAAAPTTPTTAMATSVPCRHIPSAALGVSHGGSSSCQNQQYSLHSPNQHHHHSTPSTVSSSNSRILGTSNNNNNNNSNSLPPNLMSNLHTNFSNMTPMLLPSAQQQQQIAQRTLSSHQQQQHLMNFPSPVEFNKSITASEHSGRCSHLTNSLMSNVISPLSSVANHSSSRGRRVARCTSPRTTCIWPSFNLVSTPTTDRQHFTQLPGPSNADVRTGICPQLGVLSPNSVSSTCSPNQNTQFSHSRNRPIPGQFHNVLAHPLATTTYARDKGRHRSGSSMSSEIGQYSMNSVRELTSPSAYLDSTSTYPGRCGSYSGCVGNLNRTVASSAVTGGSFSVSNQKQTMHSVTSKPVLLGQLSGIYQNVTSLKPNLLWDNFESESNNAEQHFSSNWPWSSVNTGACTNISGGISEMENDFNSFLDNCQMPLGIANSSSIGICDDTSRDSGLVLDMTLPPTSPLEQSSSGFLGSNLEADLLSQLTQSASQHRVSASGLFDDIHSACSRFSQDVVFHSPSDDGFLSTHSASEEQDPNHALLVTVNTSIDCSSLPNSYGSNPVNIPGKGNAKDVKSMQMYSFLDSITSRSGILSRHDSLQQPIGHLHQPGGIIQSGQLTKSQCNKGWPSSFADEIGHRHSSPMSSPVSINNANSSRYASIVGGASLGRVSQAIGVDLNTSGLASSASSGSTGAAVFGAIGSRVLHSMTTETAGPSDSSQPVRPQECSECLTQISADTMSSTSSPIQLDSGTAGTSSRIFSSHSRNENFSNLPQSPILLSSPFSNPGCDLERLTLRRELDEIRQRLDSKEGEVEVLKKQRDFVTEHLRDSLGVIRQLFHSLNMSSTASTDLFKPLFVDTETNLSSDQSTGCYAQSLSSESNPCDIFKTCMQASPTTNLSPTGPVDSLGRNQLQQQQQEALAALFANPLVSALLTTQTDVSATDNSKMKSDMQVPNWNPLDNHNITEIQSSEYRSKHAMNNPSFPSTINTTTATGGAHCNSDNDDDDDLFSASGLLSLSNQESCDLEGEEGTVDSSNNEFIPPSHDTTSGNPASITTETASAAAAAAAANTPMLHNLCIDNCRDSKNEHHNDDEDDGENKASSHSSLCNKYPVDGKQQSL
ncbi:unnamed protein product [Heterobilharzia americana]|nr:unnamed protein product [Heterobilharzia americana]